MEWNAATVWLFWDQPSSYVPSSYIRGLCLEQEDENMQQYQPGACTYTAAVIPYRQYTTELINTMGCFIGPPPLISPSPSRLSLPSLATYPVTCQEHTRKERGNHVWWRTFSTGSPHLQTRGVAGKGCG